MILNIIDKIYENSNFKKYLIIAFIILVLLLVVVYIIGRIEYKKRNAPKKDPEEDIKDITFDLPSEANNIKEDVTFEMPVLTRNLEDFKKNLEEEIEREEEIAVRKTSGTKVEQETKSIKILDKDVIDDTAIVSLKNIEIANQNSETDNQDNFKDSNQEFIPPKKETMILETIEIPELASAKKKSNEVVLKIIDTDPVTLPKKNVDSSKSMSNVNNDF